MQALPDENERRARRGRPACAADVHRRRAGQQEDETGRPFVGAAGHLLDRMLAAIGLRREQVYICNIVKCRPPQNRVPEADERAACMDYLRQQVALVRPKVIVCLGSTPTRALLGEQMRITRDRGVWQLKRACGSCRRITWRPAARRGQKAPSVGGFSGDTRQAHRAERISQDGGGLMEEQKSVRRFGR